MLGEVLGEEGKSPFEREREGETVKMSVEAASSQLASGTQTYNKLSFQLKPMRPSSTPRLLQSAYSNSSSAPPPVSGDISISTPGLS
ncbi:hypothetical protein EYF80_039887 [Liparis tanakae]|uniref:Uncharacterized protein n=1 Tax=Liparis tanakae TaxID=230148 RepID=A0A4Z2G8N0_9TELE|nr:hypothetical protein EYF80_039887 [Liparis tanakae]